MVCVIDATSFFAVLGKRVRRLREERGMTLEDMISRGFSARHWQQIEKGRPINCTTLLRITIVFDISLSFLVRRLPPPIFISEESQRSLGGRVVNTPDWHS
jgi:transcriptional regulator with XRE-family HTH domain